MDSKSYVINLKPIPWRRARLNGKYFFDSQSADRLAFGLHIAQQARGDQLWTGPVLMDITFYMPIPKLYKDRPPTIYHHQRADLDNLCKFALDAITDTQVIWKEDSIVSILRAQKLYDPNPRTEFTITQLPKMYTKDLPTFGHHDRLCLYCYRHCNC